MYNRLIKVTGIDLVKLIQAVYENSSPIGMGMLHFNPAPLSDEEAKKIIGEVATYSPPTADWPATIIYMDYVNGRCCKFAVYKDLNNDLYVRDYWPDHNDAELHKMLKALGFEQQPGSN